MRKQPARTRGLPLSAAVVALVSAGLLAVLVLQPGTHLAQVADNLGSCAAALVGGAVCFWRCRNAGALRKSWAALGTGLVGWGVGQAIWSFYELVIHREVPFPSLADAGFLTFPVAAAVALLLFPRGQGTTEGRVRALLDGLIIACSLLVLSMESVLAAVIRASAETTFALVISIAYPIGDLVVATMALLALAHARKPQRPRLIWMTLGLFGLVVADSVFAYRTAMGTYETGVLTDVGWVAGFLLLGLVVTRPTSSPVTADDAAGTALDPLSMAGPSVGQLTLPYIPVVAASVVVLWQVVDGQRISVPLALLAGLVLVLVYSRQLVTLLENRRLVAAVRHQAFHDSLTGLANRALFLDRLEAALMLRRNGSQAEDSARLAVAFLDLDDFKEVNDGLGHAAGDALLVQVAARLRGAVRSSDLVARLGGDEFAVLLQDDPDASPGLGMAREDPAVVAGRLVTTVREPFDLGGQRVSVTTSVGLAVVAPQGGESAMHVLRNADLAMYAAKQSGKGRFEHFAVDMSAGLLHDLRLRQELAEALEADQFFLYYQPMYDLRTDRLCGAEALVRWAHPSGTTLAPAAFLRQAETPELMPVLGRKLLERACREVRGWLDDSAHTDGVESDFFVSVNLSALQLTDRTLPGFVERTLQRFGLEPRHLLLEVTESALLEDVDAAARVLLELSALGLRVALDDFGTGYSSLAHLHQLPVHVLKTDRTFVADITDAAQPSGLVTLVAEIGSSLDLLTVAEGVETPVQLEALRRLGYDVVQGYLLGRPGQLAHMATTITVPFVPATRL